MIQKYRLMLTLSGLLACLLNGYAAYAQDTVPSTPIGSIDEMLETCLEQDPSTAGMVKCSQTAATQWDAELNKVYQALMTELNAEGQAALRSAQRDWIDFRDAEFAAIAAIYAQLEGTMWRIVATDARTEVIKTRTLALQNYLGSFADSMF